MTAVLEPNKHEGRTAAKPAVTEPVVEVAAPSAAPVGDPAMLGLPMFVLASISLGLALTGYLPPTATAGALPIILLCAGVGILGATIWSVRLGASALACVFGMFAAFWLSYGTLVLGLTHNWFGTPTADVTRTVSAFLLTWTIGIAMLAGVTLRLPRAFTALFVLVDLALVLVLLGNEQTSTNLTKAGGWVTFVFAGLGMYLFAGASAAATGGRAFPLGKPLSS